MIFAPDLDNTLIHSYKKKRDNDICVEIKDGKELSFMSENAFKMLENLSHKCTVIPITTRSIEQFLRINLPISEYAVVSNGGVLLKNGVPDAEWVKEINRMISPYEDSFNALADALKRHEDTYFDVRIVDGVFVFTKNSSPDAALKQLKSISNSQNFVLYSLGDKVYAIPKEVNKGAALKKIKDIFNDDFIISAGDSILDIPMLRAADMAFVPYDFPDMRHGFTKADSPEFAEFILTEALKFC